MVKKLVYIFIAILVLAAFAGLGFYSYQLNLKLEALSQQLQVANEKISGLSQNALNVGDIYSRVEKSVVKIEVLPTSGKKVSGSGFFFDSQGHVVTNNHVIIDGKQVEVILSDGTILKAKIVGGDVHSDLAVVKVTESGAAVPLKLSDSNSLKVGDWVIAVGSPFGLGGSVTSGIVSQKGRLLPVQGGYSIPDVIQFDAAINPGNSGGPLLNSKGEVVGVTTAIMTSVTLRTFVGVGFAVPSNMVSKVIPALIEKGSYKHPWIGISVTNLTPPIVEAMGLKISRGVLITEVRKGSPAEMAGLRSGNKQLTINDSKVNIGGDVIIGMDGRGVKSLEDLLSYLSQKSPEDVTTLTIIRDDTELTIKVTLGTRPLN